MSSQPPTATKVILIVGLVIIALGFIFAVIVGE